MGEGWHGYRAARGRLPSGTIEHVIDGSEVGYFDLGLTSGHGRVGWRPRKDYPHCFVTGTTGAGKSRLMERWALYPLAGGWDWDVEVLDGKGAGDYWAALANGAVLRSTPEEILGALQAAVQDIRARARLMDETPIVKTLDNGVAVVDRALSFPDLPLKLRQELGLRERVIFIDELPSVVGMTIGGQKARRATKTLPARPAVEGITGASLIFTLVQLARFAGIYIVLGAQRPDAKIVDGFVRHNVRSRVLLGPGNADAEEMTLEGWITDHPERGLPRAVGDGFAIGIGDHPIVRFHADLLDRDAYLPLATPEQVSASLSDSPGPAGPAPPHVPSASGPSPADDLRAPSNGLPPSPESSTSPFSLRKKAISDTDSIGPPSMFSRVVRAVRPVATGPLVRLALRADALRNLARPVVPGPFVRDPALAVACKVDAGHRCEACGAAAPVQADHRVALMFGGADTDANLWALCTRPRGTGCHDAKTRAEMRVWRMRTRGRRGLPLAGASGLLAALRLMPLWVRFAAGCYLLGLLTGDRWGWYAVALLTATLLGPLALRGLAMKLPLLRLFVRQRGPGLDGIPNWEAKLEQEAAARGFQGWFTRRYYGYKAWLAWTRIRWAATSGTYVAGWATPALVPVLASLAVGLVT